ncbi:MAG: SDR family NAD(P)-dependent oxidoreductase [Hyphomonadaceae bacterium]|nr:SDR family NAD(P)-dependent oxidoreductase [Hyphomonadaceae bacterium]
MTVPQRSLFCFGLGDTAQYLARVCSAKGWAVGGTVRTAQKAAALGKRGWDVRVFEGAREVSPPQGSDWLISIPPDEKGCPAFHAAAERAETARSITYLSTTGVYGDLDGGWAFEWTPVNPASERAIQRVKAESQWCGVRARVALARLPGIYGPGRSALDRVQAGTARRIVKPGQVFSRVHVEDIARGLFALLEAETPAGVYHFADDAPAPPQDVIAEAARLLGQPAPPEIAFQHAELSPMARSFYSECKRVSNARTKAVLGWRPAYPSYREGLAALMNLEVPAWM